MNLVLVGMSGENLVIQKGYVRVTDDPSEKNWPTPVNRREVWPVVASIAAGIALALLLVILFV